ncbi:hypothetical protein COY90_04920 [Candidatus Roizmanbacteria bacterium CG_4_10_14_0_8_um_filter_39_9]|uniref:Glycosyl transferase n=1 Tax=Candidatus Roizmanbacteria bacterium CG_4_10_14_0_8_um_filter_39_9 TaxID=1974829 RepID=A0A2M7QBM0_9BACT|nr:MAG: hypothetical protein COY90_04920 [Candidatus Roizmanbacteria bacterium CG_4_10_14_0_8_um_filter_39_9]
MKPLKIAVLAGPLIAVPPQKYGGTERIVYNLVEGLHKNGHDVTLFSTGDSKVNCKLQYLFKEELWKGGVMTKTQNELIHERLNHYYHFFEMIRKEKFDIVHSHEGLIPLFFADMVKLPIPFLTTIHWSFQGYAYDHSDLPILYQFKKYPFISLSLNQRKTGPELNFAANVYNGVSVSSEYTGYYSEADESYMAFVGRIDNEKGIFEAVQVAHLLKKKLIVAAKYDSNRMDQFEKFKSYVDNKYVVFLGEVGEQQKLEIIAKAKLLLMPVNYEDTCPLVPLESLGCGTPTVTFAYGALPEQISDGQTGYVVNSSKDNIRGDWHFKTLGIDGLLEAVLAIYSMSQTEYLTMRNECRKQYEQKFSVDVMVKNYENVYEQNLINLKK